MWSLICHLFKELDRLNNALCKDGAEKPKFKIGTKCSLNEVPMEVITDILRMLIQVFFYQHNEECNKEENKIIQKEKKWLKID